MSDIESYLNPLFRPPLSLTVVAAGLKYVATVVILDEPLLLTCGDYRRRREATGSGAVGWRLARFVVQLLFVGLAANNLLHDLGTLAEGFPRLSAWQRSHLCAMVLAFSPNTVAAVAGAAIAQVSARWLQESPLQYCRIGKASDVVTQLFSLSMGLLYLLPLVLVSLTYGALGACAVAYSMAWDIATLPWRLASGHLGVIRLALPLVFALGLSHALCCLLIGGQVLLFEWRYPELAKRINSQGKRVKVLKAKIPNLIAASVVGRARELTSLTAPSTGDSLVDEGAGDRHLLDLGVPDTGVASTAPDGLEDAEVGSPCKTERCVLNDDLLAIIAVSKIMLCVAVPLLQISVVIAAKVFLGDTLWNASLKAFGERSWTHYVGHARESGMRAAMPLFWYYL